MASHNHFAGGGWPLPEKRRLINEISYTARKILEDIDNYINVGHLTAEQLQMLERARRGSNNVLKPNLLETKTLDELNVLGHEFTVCGFEIAVLAAAAKVRDGRESD